ncbi:SAM-dependent methyltransferase [Bradyrhizobium japonicum]|jgi:SAM-dependent methyltransferase|uniref:SAM-dependent methyltransferase n=1 Tax=Bradyrhizobium elkanii TaxID=29448 RepID=A0A1E3EJB0_BRAEL|nr:MULTISPECIES: methyltransferase domain-containing protein [Bradyrhizobium]MBP1292024.1 SAM-dependent methyltransferase [Bradyrhizobium elkanii]MBP2430343.1 SAM-dependent methyltransferase [Bradyrhizobium elkanii]MCP1736317.1 SAM-dependent methyltransferase [Bradyrhizobium elkanii]MCP1754213.1 SAM-dependent methyltransferase [Bradyrhizobium elkanii]MCP1927538.1 SAM-dependent methyltransferase [Bradyrhizobium elkanii]
MAVVRGAGLASDDLYTGEGYAEAHPGWHDEDAGTKAAKIARIVRANNITCRTIVDVGCGVGGVLNALLEHDVFRDSTAVGYDIAPYAITAAKPRERDNLRFHCGDFSQTSGSYDLLLCIDVFEHIDDYMGFLRRLRGRSKYYVFHIPLDLNVLSVLRDQPLQKRKEVGHLHYFDQATALATLRDTGFEIIDSQYTRLEDFLHLHPELRTTKTLLVNAGRRIVRTVAGEDLSVRLLGGASLMVLAS